MRIRWVLRDELSSEKFMENKIIGLLGLNYVDAVLSWCANDYVRIRGGTACM